MPADKAQLKRLRQKPGLRNKSWWGRKIAKWFAAAEADKKFLQNQIFTLCYRSKKKLVYKNFFEVVQHQNSYFCLTFISLLCLKKFCLTLLKTKKRRKNKVNSARRKLSIMTSQAYSKGLCAGFNELLRREEQKSWWLD